MNPRKEANAMPLNIIKEHFTSIHEMLSVIESRPHNDVMANSNSSEKNGKDFTGTGSYEEAKELFRHGYTEILPRIKTGVAANLKRTESRPRRTIENNVVGYAPNVPNAIMGLPNSMILTRTAPQKTKTVSIVTDITENAGTRTEEFIESGIAVLGVVNTLELRGYRVSLKVSFYNATEGNDRAFGTVNVKDYREHIDLQKLCFPLANPSMFRRLGFKWIETVPGLKASWSFGYGSFMRDLDFIKENYLASNEYFINLDITKRNEYNPEKIIAELNIEK
jgi:hypothetical protein